VVTAEVPTAPTALVAGLVAVAATGDGEPAAKPTLEVEALVAVVN